MAIQGLKSNHTLSSGTALRSPSYGMGSSSVQTCGETATYCRYSEKEIESAVILGLANQFGNRPHVIRNSSFHRGRHSQTRMHPAKGVVREVQGDSGFQMRQFLAESVRQPREPAKLHPHREVLPFHKASRNVPRIRIAGTLATVLDLVSQDL